MIARRSLVALFVLMLATPVNAADQPIAGASLALKRSSSGKEVLTFSSKDPAALFPAVGGLDDPTTAGATIELISPARATEMLTVPAGTGSPGWTSKAGPPGAYAFKNKAGISVSALSAVQFKEGKQLKLQARSFDVPLVPPSGQMAIRITMGGTRNCALFTVDTVKKDATNVYKAAKATAVGLADCSDESLGAHVFGCADGSFGGDACGGPCPAGAVCTTQDLSTCTCVAETQPCGETYPVCNGACPVGEECLATGGYPLTACGCLPTGSTACNLSQCGGACPSGQECNYYEFQFQSGCQCGPSGACGTGGDDCPPAQHCAVGSGGSFCVP